jgi:hypothetical protein
MPVAMLLGLIAPVFAAPITIIDDGGPDDNVGQKDLNSFTFDYDNQASGNIAVSWNWDDTAWSGGNTGDACALFDTDGDGFINNAVCVGVGGAGVEQYTTTYSCSDKDTDRCTAPNSVIATTSTFSTAVGGADPFAGDPTHGSSLNVCDANPACNSVDTVATGTIYLSDFGATTATLINVCSYESASPTSNPEECVINPDLPTLTINKVCDPTTDTGKFNLILDTVTEQADATCGTGTGAITTAIGAHTVSESAGTGTTLSDYTTVIGGDCASDGTITLAAGEDKTCTITNTRKPTLTINKVCDPTTDTGKFNLILDTVTRQADATCGTGTGAITTSIGAHTVSESAGTGTTLSDYTTAIGGDCASNGTITLAAGDNKTCTITNTKKGEVEVVKTVGGVAPSGTDQFVFTLRTGASSSSKGTIVSTGTATAGNGGTFTFVPKVVAGTYQLCEAVQPGFDSSLLSDPNHFILDQITSEDDNEWVCIPVTVTSGVKTTVTVNNTRPPGGMAKTIGFWKTHATCAGNNANSARPNATKLDETLASLGSVTVGILDVNTCQEAVSILNKSTLSGKKQASNAAYNFAAQYLAYKLNLEAGADDCAAAALAASQGQTLLVAYGFDGVKINPKPSKSVSALLNSYEQILDDFNNNTLSGC